MRAWVEDCREMADTVWRVSSMFHCVMLAGFWSSRRCIALEVSRNGAGVVVCRRRLQSVPWAWARSKRLGESDGRAEPGWVSVLPVNVQLR
jgi:hypothetical protein